jgi:hypothetical protein
MAQTPLSTSTPYCSAASMFIYHDPNIVFFDRIERETYYNPDLFYDYRSAHVEIMRRRKEWFERMAQAWAVLWWVPSGHRPDVAEAADGSLLVIEDREGGRLLKLTPNK